MMRRRATMGIAALSIATIGLSACGQGENPADPGNEGDPGDVQLRFAWWGADLRHRLTQEVIDAFEAEHPGITVSAEYSDWNGYWDRLSTTAAAGQLPDIFQMDEKYLRTYAEQGSLLDLAALEGLPTDSLDQDALVAGEVDDGLYGVVTAVNAYSMVTNTTLLEQVGVDVPDDSEWTWQDFAEISQEVTNGADDGVWGMQGLGVAEGDLTIWARQTGESLWTDDAGYGISNETAAQWWDYVQSLRDTGAMPPPEVMEEMRAAGQESSGIATNSAAFGLWWSNQYAALAESSGDELVLLQPPVQEEGGDSGLYYKPSMFWSASAQTEHPEEVAMFLDFLINSEQAGEILLTERGAPSNLDVREHIAPMLSDAEQASISYVDQIADVISATPPVTPQGASDFEETLQRYNLEVLFGNLTSEEAAASLSDEVNSGIE